MKNNLVTDMMTIARKDLKEVLTGQGGNRGRFLGGTTYLLLVLVIMGVFMPLQTGVQWFTDLLAPLVWTWFPVLLVISVVTDSFAGERERNTLETLLASCLSDKAILFGKISAAVVYGYTISLMSNLLAVATLNIAHPDAPVHFYSAQVGLALLLVPLLLCLLMASLGVLVSLHAPTARAAYQRLSLPMIGLFLIPVLVSNVAGEETVQRMLAFFQSADPVLLIVIALAAVLAVTAVLILIAVRRFQRAKLILE